MVGATSNFDGNSQYKCSASYSENSIVESRDVNIVNTEIAIMSIDDPLKKIREEKNPEHPLNTSCKSPWKITKKMQTRHSSGIHKSEKITKTKQQKPTKNLIGRRLPLK